MRRIPKASGKEARCSGPQTSHTPPILFFCGGGARGGKVHRQGLGRVVGAALCGGHNAAGIDEGHGEGDGLIDKSIRKDQVTEVAASSIRWKRRGQSDICSRGAQDLKGLVFEQIQFSGLFLFKKRKDIDAVAPPNWMRVLFFF